MRRWSLGGAYRRVARGPWRACTRGPTKGFLKNGAAALMREANEIGSSSGPCARQGRGVRRRSAPFRSCSSLGFGLLEENRRAVQRFARLCSYIFLDGVYSSEVMNKEAHGAALPEALVHSPSQMPLICQVAPPMPFVQADTRRTRRRAADHPPARAEENFASYRGAGRKK